ASGKSWCPANGATSITFSRSSSMIAALVPSGQKRAIQFWEFGAHQPTGAATAVVRSNTELCLSPGGRMVAVWQGIHGPDATVSTALVIMQVPTGKEIYRFKCQGGGVAGATFSPDGKQLAVVGTLRRVEILETTGWHRLRELQPPPSELDAEPDWLGF